MPRSKSNGSKPVQVGAPWRSRIVAYSDEPVDSLLANPLNWRLHNKQQQEALAGVIREVGVVQNILVNKTTQHVVDGHLRITLALRDNQPTVPVTWVELSEAEEALILATLDPIGAMASADAQKLDELLRDVSTGEAAVQEMLADLARQSGLRYGDEAALAEPSDAALNEIDRLRQKWATSLGQLWLVPSKTSPSVTHKLLCGDAFAPADMERLLDGGKPVLVHSDPPYGIDIVQVKGKQARGAADSGGAKAFGVTVPVTPFGGRNGRADRAGAPNMVRANYYKPVEGDDRPFDPSPFLSMGQIVVLWGGNYYADRLPISAGWIVWDKRGGREMAENTFAECELAWTNQQAPAVIFRHLWMGLFKESERGEQRVHPTQKPVALYAWVAERFTKPGEMILDPFAGSGPAFLAAESLGRQQVGLEIDPDYTAVILERLAGMGLSPVLADA